jgi:hypothetical protein
MEPIRLFIGTSANGEDAEAEMVYEYSLRNNTKAPLEITWMRQSHDETSVWGGWNTIMWPTPFSGYRWAIPEACGNVGRAIYTDVDMINFRDIQELWETELNGKPIAARRGKRFGGHEFCVMVIDCAKLAQYISPIYRQKHIPETHVRYINMFSGNNDLVQELDSRWNCHDGDNLEIGEFWHLHYTEMATQPWAPKWFTGTPREHPRQDLVQLWFDMRDEAIENGWSPRISNEKFGDYSIIGK